MTEIALTGMGEPKPKLVMLAAGGTGGHIFPASAVAETLVAEKIAVGLITDSRGQAFSVAGIPIPTYRIVAGTPNKRGLGIFGKLWAVVQLGIGTLQSAYRLLQLRPDVVVGFGGYAAAPTLVAAFALRIPIIMHEQNAILGRTNRMFSRLAKFIASSFPETQGLSLAEFRKTVFTGNPVRSDIAGIAKNGYPPPSVDGKIRLLITGGSQGANIFGDVIPRAIELLPACLRDSLVISQQCRAEDIEAVTKAYQKMGVRAEVATFFTDVPKRLAESHLVIMRSGASSVAELTASGRPSILVPFAKALDNHQMINARAIADHGGAFLMPQDAFKPDALAARLESYLTLPETLIQTARAAHELGVRDAAVRLARLVIKTYRLTKKIGHTADPQDEYGDSVLGNRMDERAA